MSSRCCSCRRVRTPISSGGNAPQIEIETNLADASANRRTKQEQRPSLFGLCLARRRKTEGQNEIENQIHQLRLIKYIIETNNYGKGQTGVHHCRGQRVCRCIQAEPKELREQSQTCLSYAERRLRKTLVNRRRTDARANRESSERHPSSLGDGRVAFEEDEINTMPSCLASPNSDATRQCLKASFHHCAHCSLA